MQRPTWVTVVGILMIFFGGCGGVTSDLKQIKTKALIELQDEFVDEIQIEFGSKYIDSTEKNILIELGGVDSTTLKSDTLSSKTLAETIKSISKMSPATIATIIKHGYMGLAVSILYILTGLLLLFVRKKYVIKVVIGMLILSLVFVLYQYLEIKSMELSDLFSFGLQANLVFGAIIDVILLILVLILDKSYFTQEDQMGDYYDEVETSL